MARFRAALVAAALAGALVVGIPPPPVAAGACDFVTCTLSVQMTTNGSGTWQTTKADQSLDYKINCEFVNGVKKPGSDCQEVYGTQDPTAQEITIYFRSTPASGSKDCSVPPTCSSSGFRGSFVLSANKTVSASFVLQPYGVTVSKSGAGSGTVTSVPAGIACGSTCSTTFLYGTAITLYAGPDAGAYFAGWTGACFGQGPGCSLTIPASATSTNAVFGFGTPPPTASPPGATPRATVKATPRASVPPGPTPGPSAGASASAPSESPWPVDTGLSTTEPTVPPSASPAIVPVAAAADFTPIVLAILGAGLLIATGIGVAGYALRRRGAQPPP